MLEYIIAVAVIAIYAAIFVAVRKYKFGNKRGLGTMGPLIMWRTVRGKRLIDRISKRDRFWKRMGDIAIVIVLLLFAGMLFLLLWEATIVMSIPKDKAPNPQLLLGIPGLNPVIPIGYGVLGLVVGIIVHEMSHGIMTRAEGLKVQSLGLIFLIVPLGAFVEPDEEELRKTERRKRMRVYAAGPTSNVFVSIITFLLFIGMIGSVQPVSDGSVGVLVGSDTPASRAGIQPYTLITSVNGTGISSTDTIAKISSIQPAAKVKVDGRYRGQEVHFDVNAGLALIDLVGGYPAEQGGLKVGMIFASIQSSKNTTAIRNQNDFSMTLSWQRPGDRINVSAYEWDSANSSYKYQTFAGITLVSKHEYYAKYAPSSNRDEYKDVAFMGVTSGYMGIIYANAKDLIQPSAAPFARASSVDGFFLSGLRFLSLPLLGLSPIESPMSDLYAPTGALASIPAPAFWILLNSMYWIFWISIMLGLTNALTLFVTDGTPVFKDSLDYVCTRFTKLSQEKRERWTSYITAFFSLLVLFLIFWQLIGPRIA